jgi:aldose sugar dehydrogenase
MFKLLPFLIFTPNKTCTMRYFIFCVLTIACTTATKTKQSSIETTTIQPRFVIDTVATKLKTAFGMDWLPDGRMLITERGKESEGLSILDTRTGTKVVVCNLPKIHKKGQGGTLDVLVHPDYANNGLIYLSFSAPRGKDQNTMVIERARLKDSCLIDRQEIFEALPWHEESFHFGNRMAIRDGYLYFTMGERFFERDSAQSLTNHLGKVMRLHDDGRIPTDNPFASHLFALPQIFSFGHRNPQGLVFRPGTNELWESEHGPQGGDEVNLIKPGANYGWPLITFGENYGGGEIGAGITHKEGMEQPIYKYIPSIAPGGMCFYNGDAFPAWKGNLFIAALAKTHLNRLVFVGQKVVQEERLFEKEGMHIRMVKQGPDGYLYLCEDGGMLLRLRPYVG